MSESRRPPPPPPPYPPPDPPPPPVLINASAPYTLPVMMEKFGIGSCMSLLGRVGANMDGFYFDVCNAIQGDPSGKTFQDWFGGVARNSSVPLTAAKQQLGFAGGVMDDGYNAGRAVSGVAGYNPKPFGKLEALQQKRIWGDKPWLYPRIPDDPVVPYLCYETEVNSLWPIGESLSL